MLLSVENAVTEFLLTKRHSMCPKTMVISPNSTYAALVVFPKTFTPWKISVSQTQ